MSDSGWIPVGERLPEELPDGNDAFVLVALSGGKFFSQWVTMAEYRGGMTYGFSIDSGDEVMGTTWYAPPDYLSSECDGQRITHWQPMPKHPEAK